MLFDLHIHEKTHSHDSSIDLQDIIRQARSMGLDGICITDHESMGLQEKAAWVSREMHFPVLVGAEVLTYEGDLLVYGVDQLPKAMMHAQQLIDWANQRGGVAVSAHPYRKNHRGIGDGLFSLKGLAGIESLNGNTPDDLNTKAQGTALAMNLPLLGGSDAHRLNHVGRYATRFQGAIRDMKDLVEGIKAGRVSPVAYLDGEYVDLGHQRRQEMAV